VTTKGLDVGVVGPGAMGLPMALNLLAVGARVHFTTRRPEVQARLGEAGGTAHPDVAGVARQSHLLLSSLPADEEVRSVLLEPGILGLMPTGSLIIETSTTLPATVVELAAAAARHGIAVLDAPVSGGTYGAERGTLTVMAGGDLAVLDRAAQSWV
jgi:3-hydroxyisobutyrate dehydrogenase-like beta-hydroxyacid dehydrogenase